MHFFARFYILLTTQICLAACSVSPRFPPLLDATLEELRQGLDSGLFTSTDLVTAYVARINEVQAELHVVNELNPDALFIASERDAERLRDDQSWSRYWPWRKQRGSLHGIPVLVKDNIGTYDKMNTTAGSYALVGARVKEDSTVVAKLRQAGAIILGKTSLAEWAACRSKNSTSSWSAYGGQTYGAYFPGQDPSGSSSGSAVGTSLGLTWASLGTETMGSIMHPSHLGNLVGIKPTLGLTSRYMVIPISEHRDAVGPMARTVKDAAHLLSAIAGRDPHDNYTSAIPFDKLPDYVSACRGPSFIKGKRLGVSRDLMKLTPDTTADIAPEVFEEALDTLREAGAIIVDNIAFPQIEPYQVREWFSSLLGSDFMTDLPRYFAALEVNPYNITSIQELMDFTHKHPLENYPEHDTITWENIIKSGRGNESPEFWGNYSQIPKRFGHSSILGALKNYTLDAMILPAPHVYPAAAVLGIPAITVPMGRTPVDSPVVENSFGGMNETAPNQPMGLGFTGPEFSEELLIGLAHGFEQLTMFRKRVKPYIWPATELGDVVAGRLVWTDL